MSQQPPGAHPPAQGAATAPSGATTAQPGQPGWRDRMWSLPAVVAVALASVILGGLGGAALASASDDGSDGRFGPGHGRFHREGHVRPPGMGNERQRERWREWRHEQRQMRPTDLPSPTRPTPTR